MALILRIIIILVGFCAASFAAGVILIGAMQFPDVSDIDLNFDDGAMLITATFSFIFVYGLALIPMMSVVLVAEAFRIRNLLFYAFSSAAVWAACYLSLVPFDPVTMTFNGIPHHELEVMVGAGVVAGCVYWLIAGRNAGLWRGPPSASNQPPVS